MFLLRIPNDFPQEMIGEYLKDSSPDRFIYRRATRVPDDGGTPRFLFSATIKALMCFDVLPNSAMVPLVSKRVAKILEEICRMDYELVPAEIKTKNGNIEDYYLLNILTKVAMIDRANSSLDMITGTNQIRKINKLECLTAGMQNHHLARDIDYMSYIWFSKTLKDAFKSSNIRACQFVAPNEVHP